MIIIQQYYFMPGHYGKYADALISESDHHLVYGSEVALNRANTTFVPAFQRRDVNALGFMLQRVVNSYKCYKAALKLAMSSNPANIHIVELEPFTFLWVFLRRLNFIKVVTVHSVRPAKSNSTAFNVLSFVQKKVFVIAIFLLRKYSCCTFVVHSRFHKRELKELTNRLNEDRIHVINYPCDHPVVGKPKVLSKTILIFGLLRADKGIYEFLTEFERLGAGYFLTVAGKVFDKRIYEFSGVRNITLTDKYLTEDEIDILFSKADFLVLPYPKVYSGGAGPLKDSFSRGTPVCCSDIELFEEVIEDSKAGFVFESASDLVQKLNSLNAAQYDQMARNAYNYAKQNNWAYLRNCYEKLYCQSC